MPKLKRSDRHEAGRLGRAAGVALATALLVGPGATAATTRAAQASSFDELLRRLADAPVELRSAAVFHYLNLVGGAPLVEGDTVVFLAERSGSEPPRIVGAFNGWGRTAPSSPAHRGEMTRIEGTEWYWVRMPFEPGGRVEYLIAYGDRTELDPLNPRVVQRNGRKHSWVEVRSPVRQPRSGQAARFAAAAAGRSCTG